MLSLNLWLLILIKVIKLDSQSFYQKVVGRPDGEIWFVDFAASWCRPCQMMMNDFKQAAKKVYGKFSFESAYKLNNQRDD